MTSLRLAGAAVLILTLCVGACSKPSLQENIENGLLPQAPVKGWAGWSLAERMQRYGVPGVSIAVINDFELVWAGAYGNASADQPVTPETLFQVGFMGTLLSTVTALEQVENGKLALDQPIADVLGSWRLPTGDAAAEQAVTLRHLLSNTAGLNLSQLPGYQGDDPMPTLAQMLAGEPPANTPPVHPVRPPGQPAPQTAGGWLVVQQALEEATGTPFAELAASTVLGRLGMTSSSLAQPLPADFDALAASGHRLSGAPVAGKARVFPELAAWGLWTTASDYARLMIEVARAAQKGEGQVLARETGAQMLQPVAGRSVLGALINLQGGVVRLFNVGTTPGFYARMVYFPERGCGAVVLSNSDNGRFLTLEILQSIARVYDWPGYVAAEIDPIRPAAEALDALTGRYASGGDNVLVVRRQGDHLEVREPLAGTAEEWNPIVPVVGDAYVDVNVGRRVGFKVDRRGNGLAYVFQGQGGQEITLKRLPDDAPPTAGELLESGRVEAAIAAYRQLGEIDEDRINLTGYALVNAGKLDAAIAVLELNAELHPQSANAFDSLVDAYLAKGDRAKALAAARQVEHNLAVDTSTRSELRELVEGRVSYLLRRLEGPSGG